MRFLAIFQKELSSYFTSFLAYVVIAVFLVLSGFFFYTNLAFFILQGGFDLNRGLWQYQFHDMRLVLLVIAPLLTMRLFAEERRQGTLELLWTYPLRDVSLVAGKYAAALVVLVLMLSLTASFPTVLTFFYPVDGAPVAAGYLGLFLLGASFLACGVFVSSLTDSQLVAGTVTFGLLLLFWVITWNQAAASETVIGYLTAVSLFDRFFLFARGAIDSKDLVFFLLFVVVFLFGTLLSLESRHWRGIR
ncbi:MAG: ABC transporter permease subunit [Candidatus Binatia bacterium]